MVLAEIVPGHDDDFPRPGTQGGQVSIVQPGKIRLGVVAPDAVISAADRPVIRRYPEAPGDVGLILRHERRGAGRGEQIGGVGQAVPVAVPAVRPNVGDEKEFVPLLPQQLPDFAPAAVRHRRPRNRRSFQVVDAVSTEMDHAVDAVHLPRRRRLRNHPERGMQDLHPLVPGDAAVLRIACRLIADIREDSELQIILLRRLHPFEIVRKVVERFVREGQRLRRIIVRNRQHVEENKIEPGFADPLHMLPRRGEFERQISLLSVQHGLLRQRGQRQRIILRLAAVLVHAVIVRVERFARHRADE